MDVMAIQRAAAKEEEATATVAAALGSCIRSHCSRIRSELPASGTRCVEPHVAQQGQCHCRCGLLLSMCCCNAAAGPQM